MSRHTSLAAFFATVVIAVPAAWHVLDADIQTDGPATRPNQQVLHTAGAEIKLDLDRGVLLSGHKLKATLVATSETPKKIALTVRVLEDNGMGGERVPIPATVVTRKKILIDAAPGGGTPVELAFELGAPKKKGRVQWYDIDVAPTGIKGDAIAYYDAEDDAGNAVPANAAKAGAAVWSGNSFGLAIEPPAKVPAEGPFTVGVRVTNTTKKPMEYAEVTLGGPQLDFNGMEGLTTLYQGDDGEFDVTMKDQGEQPAIAPGEQRLVQFDVTPKHDGVKAFTLVAQAHGDQAGAALEVTTITRPSVEAATQPTVAANTR